MDTIIDAFADKAKRYLHHIDTRRVFPAAEDLQKMQALDVPLQEDPIDALAVIEELDALAAPATVASTGRRYFGFVVGGVLPAPLAANLLAGVWDQNAGIEAASPIGAYLETVCRKWLIDLLQLPAQTQVGFVTGATMANFTGLAAARHALLKQVGWDVEEDGLFDAPPIRVIVGEEVHASLLKALSMLGLGRKRVMRIPVDDQGRMKAQLIPRDSEPTIICVQAGNVNTGAFDPIEEVCAIAAASKAWVHVDGAFGLWANASPRHAHLTKGIANADSWATDAHKWLNVPYDSGIVFVKDRAALIAAMSASAAYLIEGQTREPFHHVPEMSRRARGMEIWSALRSLGRQGLADLIESNCACATLFAERLTSAGYRVLNDVVLNQVLVSFGASETTARIIKRVQADGTCWCGGTSWQGQAAMRISVSSWKTTMADVEKSAAAIIRIAAEG